MIYILPQIQEPGLIITRSLNQYPNIIAQTSDEVQPIELNETSFVVFDEMLLSKQETHIDLFFTGGRHNNIDIYFFSKLFSFTKNTIRNNCNITFFI